MRRSFYKAGRLSSTPGDDAVISQVLTGLQPLNLGGNKESFIYVPKTYNHNTPAALALMLHGAGGVAEHGLSLIRKYADDKNIILIAPASQDYSWDIIASNSFGKDVIFIDQALAFVFERFAVDTSRIAIGGFSDGASYSLSIGLGNANLFTHIIAFSPGFFYTYEHNGKPQVFISHGTHDAVLPINPCSRRIVPRLQNMQIPVIYKEFNGEHEIPAPISKAAVEWFTTKND